VKNEVLHRVKKESNNVHTIRRRQATWIHHILSRNCLLKHVTGGKIEESIEVMGTEGRQRELETERRKARSHCVENSLWKWQTTK
jgi:hypothetical protein